MNRFSLALVLLPLSALAAEEFDSGVAVTEGDEITDEAVIEGPNRAAPPQVLPATPLDLSEPEVHELSGGVEARLVQVDDVRKVEVRVIFHKGSFDLDSPASPASDVMGWVQDQATKGITAEEMSELKNVHDISLWSDISNHEHELGLAVPREDLELGLDLMRQVMHEPAFKGSEVKRYVKESARFLEVDGPSDAGTVASYALSHAWYPAGHPYGVRPNLTALWRVKPGDCQTRHATLLDTAAITVLVVGDVTWDEIALPLKNMLGPAGDASPRSERAATPEHSGTRIFAVDMPNAEQSVIRMRVAAPPWTHDDYLGFRVMNFNLGGNFMSRLNANLREDKGYTYGAGSQYNAWEKNAHLTVVVDVAARNTLPAIREIDHEIARVVAEGVTPSEIGAASADSISSWNTVRRTAEDAVGFYSSLLANQIDAAQARTRLEALATITPAETQVIAQRWLSDDAPRVWVIVGPKSVIESDLAELGEVQWISADEAMLGTNL